MQRVDQCIHPGRRVLLSDLGQVGIPCGSGWTGVAEQSLDMPEAQALFKQVCSEGMSKRMDGNFF
jgi:hypothetical protein